MKLKKSKFKILVYGAEKKGYQTPKEQFDIGKNITIEFAHFNTNKKFQDYNGLIVFQGIWARWKEIQTTFEIKRYLTDLQKDELNKRMKELILLVRKGGFICFLLDRMTNKDYDLALKVLKLYPSTYIKEIDDYPYSKSKYDELRKYFEIYGVAKTSISHLGNADFKIISGPDRNRAYAVCFNRQFYFLPCHCPNKTTNDTVKLFKVLSKGLVSLFKKFYTELPEWGDNFKFNKEEGLLTREDELVKELEQITDEISFFKNLKKILFLTGEDLRKDIAEIFEKIFEFEIYRKDEGLEDLKLIKTISKKESKILALLEIKGVNRNVTREAINQVDNHRERNNLLFSTQGLLIVNTFMKKAQSIEDKDKPINKEQIKHSVKQNVLMLRTIDLLRLVNLLISDKNKLPEFKKIILSENGWLEVKEDIYIIHKNG